MLKILNIDYITSVIDNIDNWKKEFDNFIEQLLKVLDKAIINWEKTIPLKSIKWKFPVTNVKYWLLVDYCWDEQSDNNEIDIGKIIYYLLSPETLFNNYMWHSRYWLNNIWYNKENVIKIYEFLYKVTNNDLLKWFIDKYNNTWILSIYSAIDIFFIEYDNNNLYNNPYDNKKIVLDLGWDWLYTQEVSFDLLKSNKEVLNFIYNAYRKDLSEKSINKYDKNYYIEIYNKAIWDYNTQKSLDWLASAMLNKKVETIFTEDDIYEKYKENVSRGDLIKKTIFNLYVFEKKDKFEILKVLNWLLNVLDKKYDSNYIFLSFLSEYDTVVKTILNKNWHWEYNSLILKEHLKNSKDKFEIIYDWYNKDEVDVEKVERDIFEIYRIARKWEELNQAVEKTQKRLKK